MIKILKINEMCKGKFLRLKEVFFDYKGKRRRWEVCNSMDSVSVLLFDKDKDALILVKQFRLPVYLKNGNGFTYELCAGICDKNMPEISIAKEEILEETGYEVKESDIEKITQTWASVGSSGAKQTIFYAEVSQKLKISKGGGIDDEDIEIYELPVDKIEEFVFDETKAKTAGAVFALTWWLKTKKGEK